LSGRYFFNYALAAGSPAGGLVAAFSDFGRFLGPTVAFAWAAWSGPAAIPARRRPSGLYTKPRALPAG